MTLPAGHPNLDLFGRIYTAFTSGDMETLGNDFSDDIVWHTPGANPLAGVYRGKAATFQSFADEFQLSRGTYQVRLRDVLANDEHIVAFLHATAQRDGRTLDQNYALVFRVHDGKIIEAWEVWRDQALVDSFWS